MQWEWEYKGWWASTGLGKTPRSRYRGGFAPPSPPVVVVLIWLLFEFIWVYLNLFEFIWIYLELFEFIWIYLILFEIIWIYWCYNGNVIENRYAIRHTRCAISDTRYATRERRFKWILGITSNQNRTNSHNQNQLTVRNKSNSHPKTLSSIT